MDALTSRTTVILVVVTFVLTNGEAPECGSSSNCHYVSWAFDANCKNLSLQYIPEECSEAKMLDLRYNNITRLLENVFASFTNLFYVDLQNNYLTYIHPNAFVGNTMTSYIYFQENLLTHVENNTFTGVANLLQLYLNKNHINLIEVNAFSGLEKLETLYLSNNNLSVITLEILSNLSSLRYLHLAHNHLTFLQNDTFSDLENMRYVDLNFNDISIIQSDAFKGLVSLRVLKLAQNDIISIGYNALLPTHHLSLLDLSGNKVPTISNFSFIFQILDEFYIESNPLQCDAALEPVKSWYLKHNSSDISDNPMCDKPECLNGHELKVVNLGFCETYVARDVGDSNICNISCTNETNDMPLIDRTETGRNFMSQTIAVKIAVPLSVLCLIFLVIFFIVLYFCGCIACEKNKQNTRYIPVPYNGSKDQAPPDVPLNNDKNNNTNVII